MPGTGAAGPEWIAIIRHGEKLGDPATDNEADGPDLSPQGQKRAQLLAAGLPQIVGPPDCLIATRASHISNRPVETITPLAEALGLTIDSEWKNDEYPALAEAIQSQPEYIGKHIVICWHHGNIPSLATALGANNVPTVWSGDVFDRIWKIEYTGAQPTFADLPQRLLPGDSDQ